MGLAARTAVVNANFAAFGIAVTVTRPAPDDTPIEATGLWLTPTTLEAPASGEFRRREQRQGMALRRSDVPTVPRGTVILAAERDGDDPVHWRVDGFELEEAEHVRVALVRAPDLDEA